MCDVSSGTRELVARALKLLDSPDFLSDDSASVIGQGVARLLAAACPESAADLARASRRVEERLLGGDLRFLAPAIALDVRVADLRAGISLPPTMASVQKWVADPGAPVPFVLTTFAHVAFFASVAEHEGNAEDVRARAGALAIVAGSHLAALAAFRAAVPRLAAALTALADEWERRKLNTPNGIITVFRDGDPAAFCGLSEDCRAVFDEVMTDVATLFVSPLSESPLRDCAAAPAIPATSYAPKASGAFVPVAYAPAFSAPTVGALAAAMGALPVPSPIATLDGLVSKVAPDAWSRYASGELTAPQLAAALAKTSAAADLSACFGNICRFSRYLARDLLLIPSAMGALADASAAGDWLAQPNPLVPGAIPAVCSLWARTPAPRKSSPWAAARACGSPPSAWTSPATANGYADAAAASLNPVGPAPSDAALLAAQQALSPLATSVYNSRFAALAPACARLAELVVVVVRAAGSEDPRVVLAGSTAALACAKSRTVQQWMNGNNYPTSRGTPGAYWRLLANALAPAAPRLVADAQRAIAAAERPPPPPPSAPVLALAVAVFSAAAVFVLVLILSLAARAAIGPAVERYESDSPQLARFYKNEYRPSPSALSV